MNNIEIARIFREISEILQIKGENVFRVRAYERAAQTIQSLTEDIENFAKEGRLTEIPGIGKDLAAKIEEFLGTGRVKMLEDLKKKIPEGLLELLNIPSVGPKTAKLLSEKLKIKNIEGLKKAIKNKQLEGVFGIKEKTIENIKKGIEILEGGRERLTLGQATLIADEFLNYFKREPSIKELCLAGSLRRQKETVRDIDILVISANPRRVMDIFTALPTVKDILAKGETKSSVRTHSGVQVDCRVVSQKSFGAALIYFTGSKNFNIKLRQLAIKKGFKVNEYGVFRNNRFLAGKSEEEVFKLLGMSFVAPELREDTGEVELALKNRLPSLVEHKDIKGDLHVHSNWSDGANTIQEMAQAALKSGLSYIGATDHSQSLKVAGGLSTRELKKKKAEIDKINKRLKGLRVLFSTEADIDAEGRIDYPDDTLKEFDVVVAAIHSGFKQPREQLTKRMIKACNSKYVHIIAHPTGRLWGVREPYDLDIEKVFKAAKETNTHLEINAFPERLDLDSLNCRKAKEIGVGLAINTDAHSFGQLETMKFGVSVARRGWLSKEDVINTLEAEELLKKIKK
ncbi:MAG: DNA polymerase/3'-5' exonuclease PolX [Candidatus Omnitrophota bacterium]